MCNSKVYLKKVQKKQHHESGVRTRPAVEGRILPTVFAGVGAADKLAKARRHDGDTFEMSMAAEDAQLRVGFMAL